MKFATLRCKFENGGNKHENSNYFRYTWEFGSIKSNSNRYRKKEK